MARRSFTRMSETFMVSSMRVGHIEWNWIEEMLCH